MITEYEPADSTIALDADRGVSYDEDCFLDSKSNTGVIFEKSSLVEFGRWLRNRHAKNRTHGSQLSRV